jgi:hypothetical protein
VNGKAGLDQEAVPDFWSEERRKTRTKGVRTSLAFTREMAQATPAKSNRFFLLS